MITTALRTALSAIASSLEIPVAVILLFFIAYALFSIGWLISEHFTEHRHMTACLPQLLDELRDNPSELIDCIEKSGLLKRQKEAALELTRHPGFTNKMRSALAENLLEKEQQRYSRKLKATDLAAKLSPTFGLLGTLIPLGPGIIALGNGDTYALSVSLRTAFDTTIAGLIAAAVFLVVSTIRRRWYSSYMNDLETLADCVLELEENK